MIGIYPQETSTSHPHLLHVWVPDEMFERLYEDGETLKGIVLTAKGCDLLAFFSADAPSSTQPSEGQGV